MPRQPSPRRAGPIRQAVPLRRPSAKGLRSLDARGDRRRAPRGTMLLGVGAMVAVAALTLGVLTLSGAAPPGPDATDRTGLGPPASGASIPPSGPGASADPAATPGPGATTEPGGTQPPSAEPSAAGPTSPEPEELTGYVWPLRDARLTNFFSRRTDGFVVIDGRRVHEGIDLATWCGDRVRAAHDGVVVAAGRKAAAEMGFSDSLEPFFERVERRGTLGYYSLTVVIDDGNGYRSVYAHLSEALVEPGDVVEAGDFVGYEGATGIATGCHLHYELIRMDGPWIPVFEKFVRDELYPPFVRERVDPMRVLSLDAPNAPYCSGVQPPKRSPGLGRPTAERPCPTAPPSPSPTVLLDPSPSPSTGPSASPEPSGSPEPSASGVPSEAPTPSP